MTQTVTLVTADISIPQYKELSKKNKEFKTILTTDKDLPSKLTDQNIFVRPLSFPLKQGALDGIDGDCYLWGFNTQQALTLKANLIAKDLPVFIPHDWTEGSELPLLIAAIPDAHKAIWHKAAAKNNTIAPSETKEKLLKTMKEALSDLVLKPNFIVYGVIDKGCLAICYGSSTSGKTFLVIDLAFAIVRGVPWRGKKVRKGKVLYICAEGYTGFQRRLAAFKKYYSFDDPEDNFYIIGKKGVQFRNDEDLEAIEAEIAELEKSGIKFSLIVIDTLAQVSAGADENTAKDMAPILKRLERLIVPNETSVLIIAHSGKDPRAGIRGTSIFKPASDYVIRVTKPSDPSTDGEQSEHRAALMEKVKDGREGEVFYFDLREVLIHLADPDDDEDMDVKSCVVEHVLIEKVVLKGKNAVLQQISVTPNKSKSDLAAILKVDLPNLSKQTDSLTKSGLVKHSKKGKSTTYTITDKGKDFLDTLCPTPPLQLISKEISDESAVLANEL